MSMYRLRSVCYTDSDGLCSKEALVDVVRSGLEHLGNTEVDRGVGEDTGSSVVVAGALGVVGEQCSRLEVAGGGEEEDPVARGGDGAA